MGEATEATYFDVLIVTPLEEEFQTALTAFPMKRDRSTATEIRFEVEVPGTSLRALLILQSDMGRTATGMSTASALSEFTAGLVVCVGIAGGMSSDVAIGDVCYTGDVLDVLDNAKITERESGELDIAFSPTHYSTPLDVITALNLNRIDPVLADAYEAWRRGRYEAGVELLPGEFIGRQGKKERIAKPTARCGTIVCGSVAKSPKYKEKLTLLDRKALAIETESGGLFSHAMNRGMAALTVRGISDYADKNKNRFEEDTSGHGRTIAAVNAVTFLRWQLSTARMLAVLDRQKANHLKSASQLELLPPQSGDQLEEAIRQLGDEIMGKLRELSPSYNLQARGYRLPVPRIRLCDARLVESRWSDPLEVRDAVRDSQPLLLALPKEYPDHSLSWILAHDLVTAQIGNKQVFPVVIEAKRLQRPRHGVKEAFTSELRDVSSSETAQIVVIIDDFTFDSKTRVDFLADEIEKNPEFLYIIVTRSDTNFLLESEFTGKTSASISRVCDVSFVEIAYFLQKNFDMAAAASEVVATRLRDTGGSMPPWWLEALVLWIDPKASGLTHPSSVRLRLTPSPARGEGRAPSSAGPFVWVRVVRGSKGRRPPPAPRAKFLARPSPCVTLNEQGTSPNRSFSS